MIASNSDVVPTTSPQATALSTPHHHIHVHGPKGIAALPRLHQTLITSGIALRLGVVGLLLGLLWSVVWWALS